jgi:hypothetical protein
VYTPLAFSEFALISSCSVLETPVSELVVEVREAALKSSVLESHDHSTVPATNFDNDTDPDSNSLLLGFTLPTTALVIVTNGITGDTTFTTTPADPDRFLDESCTSSDTLEVVLADEAGATSVNDSVPLMETGQVLVIVGEVCRQDHVNRRPALVPTTPLKSES